MSARNRSLAFAAVVALAAALRCVAGGGGAPAAASSPITGQGLGARPAIGGSDAGFAVPTYAVNIIVHTGQSRSTGSYATPPKTTTQPYSNTWLHDSNGHYDFNQSSNTGLSLIPLVGGSYSPTNVDGGDGTPYPLNLYSNGESQAPSEANELTYLTGAASGIVIDVEQVGCSGASLAQISDGGSCNTWNAMLYSVTKVCSLAATAGKTCGVIAMVMVHGQTDAGGILGTYETNLVNYRSVAQSALYAITGQSSATPMPMFIVQQTGEPAMNGATSYQPNASHDQVQILRDHPGLFIGVDQDFLDPPNPTDYLHALDYRIDGFAIGRAISQYLHGQSHTPVIATGVTCVGTGSSTTVTIEYNVPVPPLVFEGDVTAPHAAGTTLGAGGSVFPDAGGWTGCQGFGGWAGAISSTPGNPSNGTPVPCTSASLGGDGTSVVLHFASTVGTVEYGWTPDGLGGTTYSAFFGGRSGTLHDSDTFTGLTSVSPILDASAPGYGQIANWAWIDAYVSGTTIWPTACH
jgi:hypothetical protein